MKRKITALCACLALALCLLPLLAQRAEAADLDYIESYDISVTPNTDDGSLDIQVQIDWQVLDEGPVTWVQIGIPNGSIRDAAAMTDNIHSLSYDNSYMYVYFTRGYDDGETIHFAYSWTQEYMYDLDGGAVTYDYTPGWFDEAKIGRMTLTWNDPAGLTASRLDCSAGQQGQQSPYRFEQEQLGHGERMNLIVLYADWPTQLSPENSAANVPQSDSSWNGYDGHESDTDALTAVIVVLVLAFIFLRIVLRHSDGYHGGFGAPRYVFVNNLWFPAGPDGRPKPGSVGTKHRPSPPPSHHGGGFGGGSRGGGFGGGGFGGGGGHCACASSCACACACACAGGGRAGCSAKNLYGAVHLDETLTRRMDEGNPSVHHP